MSAVRVGVDTGGTFTDFVLVSDDGLRIHKLPSTPADASAAVLQGVDERFNLVLERREG